MFCLVFTAPKGQIKISVFPEWSSEHWLCFTRNQNQSILPSRSYEVQIIKNYVMNHELSFFIPLATKLFSFYFSGL